MRVLLATWGSRGDVEPLAALALALRRRGAEVRVCAPPDDEHEALLARAGVPLIPLGPPAGLRWRCGPGCANRRGLLPG
jgi:vancomycin aglycone glucosyltransferase